MSEEETRVENTAQEVQEVIDPIEESNETTETSSQEDNSVNVEELQRELDQERERRQELQDNLELIKSNTPKEKIQEETEEDFFGDLTDDDLPTVGDIRKIMKQQKKEQSRLSQERIVSAKYEDYNEVVRKYLPEAIKENKSLIKDLDSSENAALLAYNIAKVRQLSSEGNIKAKPKRSNVAERIEANASKPRSVSSVGGTSSMSTADYYANLSEEDFYKLASKNLDL